MISLYIRRFNTLLGHKQCQNAVKNMCTTSSKNFACTATCGGSSTKVSAFRSQSPTKMTIREYLKCYNASNGCKNQSVGPHEGSRAGQHTSNRRLCLVEAKSHPTNYTSLGNIPYVWNNLSKPKITNTSNYKPRFLAIHVGCMHTGSNVGQNGKCEPPKGEIGELDERNGYKLLFECIKSERKIIIPTMVALMISSGVISAFPMAIGEFINNYNAAVSLPLYKCLATIGAASLASFLRCLLSIMAAERISMRLRTSVFGSLLNKSIEFHDIHSSGKLTSVISSWYKLPPVHEITDDVQVASGIINYTCHLIRSFTTALVGIVLSISLAPATFFTFTAAPVAASVFLLAYFSRNLRRLVTLRMQHLARVVEHGEHVLANVRNVKSFNSESLEQSQFDKKLQQVFDISFNVAKLNSTTNAVAVASVGGLVLATVKASADLVISGTMKVGDVTSLLMYTALAGASLQNCWYAWAELQKCIGAAVNLASYSSSNMCENDGGLPVPGKKPMSIVFDKVSFYYPTRSDVLVLDNVSFQIRPGSRIVIFGSSGCGKSTILQLLLGFYTPTSGSILLDGKSILELNKRQARANMAWMDQNSSIFNFSLRDNVLYGSNNIESNKDIEEKLKIVYEMAQMREFVSTLPHGDKTELGASGHSLSGGQVQRVALARIFNKDCGIYLLDEPTSSLDPETEIQVIENLRKYLKGKTTLVVTHRPNMLKLAQYVMMVHNGQVVQFGEKDKVLANPCQQLKNLLDCTDNV